MRKVGKIKSKNILGNSEVSALALRIAFPFSAGFARPFKARGFLH